MSGKPELNDLSLHGVACVRRIVSSNRCHIVKLPPHQAITSLTAPSLFRI